MHLYDVVVIGAGPYGLSVAAHLKGRGLRVRTFGSPMQTWREHMPVGMLLKSDGFASNLSDPEGLFPLRRYCEQQGLPYDDRRCPVTLETFVAYGEAFQQRFVPDLDPRPVTALRQLPDGEFLLTAGGVEQLRARRVVLAVGISHFAYVPPELRGLPDELLSHSSSHREPSRFRGREVSVIGSGASAVDLATLLQEAGAKVCVLTRRPALEFHEPPSPRRSLRQRLRYPSSGLGPGWPSWVYSHAPQLFRHLPPRRRLRIVRTHLGPAGGWAMRSRFSGQVALRTSVHCLGGEPAGGRLRLRLGTPEGEQTALTDHLIVATGYRPELTRLPFLEADLRSAVATLEGTPVLSANFESSVPGLYFVGLAAAGSFGPLMRFAYGATYTARRLAAHLGSRRPFPGTVRASALPGEARA